MLALGLLLDLGKKKKKKGRIIRSKLIVMQSYRDLYNMLSQQSDKEGMPDAASP